MNNLWKEDPTYLLLPRPNDPPSQLRIPKVAGTLSPEVTVANDRAFEAEVREGMSTKTHPITDGSSARVTCHLFWPSEGVEWLIVMSYFGLKDLKLTQQYDSGRNNYSRP